MIFWHCGLSPLSLPPLSTKNTEVFLTRAILRNPYNIKNRPLSSIQEESGRFIMMRLMFQFFALASSASCTPEIMLFSCSLL